MTDRQPPRRVGRSEEASLAERARYEHDKVAVTRMLSRLTADDRALFESALGLDGAAVRDRIKSRTI